MGYQVPPGRAKLSEALDIAQRAASRLEKIIKRHMNSTMQKYAQRFHFNSLVSRFNSLSELWGKTMRSREEGDRPAPAMADREGPREQLPQPRRHGVDVVDR